MKSRTVALFGAIILAACLTGCGGGGGGGSDSDPDRIAPLVHNKYPDSASINVALSSTITVTFNEEIALDTINKDNITLLKDGIPVAGSVTYVGTSALFDPDDNLLPGASYTVTVTTGVKDVAGNALAAPVTWIFTTENTAASDTTGPKILDVFPRPGATNVPVDSAIVVYFNEPVIPFDYGLVEGSPVAVTFNDTYTTVTLKPAEPMKANVTYALGIMVNDMAGNPMSEVYLWEFKTSP